MKKLLMAVAALACLGSVALAGPNAGGALILHSNPAVTLTTDIANYCGLGNLTDCEAAITSRPTDENLGILHVIAAFPDGSSPRVSVVNFGWTYPQPVDPINPVPGDVILGPVGGCGDGDFATANWPDSGEGTAVTWNAARTTQLVDVYWVNAYGYVAPTALQLAPHPTQGARFADDDVPSNLDDIVGLGRFGFGQAGNAPCPIVQAFGACCFSDGSCQVLTPSECQAAGGVYQGDNTQCTPGLCPLPVGACCFEDGSCLVLTAGECAAGGGVYRGDNVPCTPDLCPPPPDPTGACCIPGALCQILTAEQCAAQGGDYKGDNVPCDPDPCVVIPTIETTWGQVKSIYR